MPETGPYDTSLVGGDGLAHVELLMQRWFQSSRLIGSQNCWGWKTSLKIILLNLVPQFKQGQPENIAQNWFWFLKLYLFWKYLIVAEYCTFSWEREKKKSILKRSPCWFCCVVPFIFEQKWFPFIQCCILFKEKLVIFLSMEVFHGPHKIFMNHNN